MDVEEDLMIVDEVGVSSQQAGREKTSVRPVFSDPDRVYCRVADPGQEKLRRGERMRTRFGTAWCEIRMSPGENLQLAPNVGLLFQTLQVLGAARVKVTGTEGGSKINNNVIGVDFFVIIEPGHESSAMIQGKGVELVIRGLDNRNVDSLLKLQMSEGATEIADMCKGEETDDNRVIGFS
ncbi:hypothetical protein HELRODRAFT_160102 [Helobdella robusta]|uniref:Uncharacterized protein n=1 Tax=Helobdella robusta TaxID=6412 RepID=T1EPS6_HELRO|nr:hypothetical protein HELRODRAFT_160102 [Helobdella robusta]ESO05997.1 hypothetical protein HELRODRAFT_160102 [Helobdella robusta]